MLEDHAVDIQDEVVSLAAAAAAREPELRGTRDSGRYANTVRVSAPQGSTFDGMTGRVVRVQDGTVFVRLPLATLPFAPGELVVLS